MSNGKINAHTPAPWQVIPPRKPAASGEGYQIKSDLMVGNWRGYVTSIIHDSPNAEANARLISAAPELLAALKAALADYDAVDAVTNHSINLARAAIAKAEGGA